MSDTKLRKQFFFFTCHYEITFREFLQFIPNYMSNVNAKKYYVLNSAVTKRNV